MTRSFRTIHHTTLLFIAILLLQFLFFQVVAAREPVGKTAAKNVIKVGCLFPMTGPGTLYGEDSAAAIEVALDELNESKQFDGLELKVSIGDTKSKPLTAVQLARNFIDKEGVHFLCGAVSSSVALAVTEVSKNKKVIFIGTDHASPRLVDESLHPYYFRMSNGTRQSMRAGAKYIVNEYGKRSQLRIAFIGPDYDYGYRAWDDLRFYLQQQKVNFQTSIELWPKLNEQDYDIYIDALINAKPDIVVNGHWGKDLVNFIRQANLSQLFDQVEFMNFDAGGNFETLAALGDDMPLGLVLSARHHINWPETPDNKQFVGRFYAKTGRYPSYAAEGAYSGIKAIATVVNESEWPLSSESLIKAFQSLRIKLPEDPSGFQSYMDPDTHQILQVQAIGRTVRNSAYLPATVMLGDWFVYYPPLQWTFGQKR